MALPAEDHLHLAMNRTLALALAALAVPAHAQNQGLRLTTGVDGFVEVPASPRLVPDSGITLEAWVTYDDATLPPGIAWPTLVRENAAAAAESYFLRVDAGSTSATVLRFKVVTSGGLQLSARWTFTPGQLTTWTHVAGTYDGAVARLLINGVEVAQAAGAGTLRNQGGTLRIGKGDDATANAGEVWNGEIDEVRLWPFARTAAEIQAGMLQELAGVPGGVSTWNFNGNAADSSGTLHGVANGSAAFVANSLGLTAFSTSGSSSYGGPTTSCAVPPDVSITCLPRVGNAAFALAGIGAPLNGGGVLLLSARALSAPIVFLGAAIWVDPSAALVLIPCTASPLGSTRVPLPVPNNLALARSPLAAQFAWADACGPSGLAATAGLAVGILP